MQRHDIRLGHALGVDALGGLDLGQRLDPVAQGCGAFKLHLFAGFGHLTRKIGLHIGGLALQEALGIGNEGGIALWTDLGHTGSRTALDLKLQAGAGAPVKHGVRAVAQQKDLLQLIERPGHGPCRSKGAEIAALFRFLAAMLLDLGEGMLFADQDIGKAFVVAQQNIVARFELFDQVLFKQQRLGFGARGQKHHRGGFKDHPGDPRRMARGPSVIGHPRPQVAGLADIQNLALGVQHPVNAGRAIQHPEIGLDNLMAGWENRLIGHAAALSLRGVILALAAMIGGLRAREKLSTLSVDNLEEKFCGSLKFPCIQPVSSVCLFFRHLSNPLNINKRFLSPWQIPDKSGEFVWVL